MLSENWFGCLFLALPLIGLAAWARAEQGSWLAPGAFFSLIWTLYLLLPLLLAPDLDVWPGAVVAIVLASGTIYTGSVMGLGGLLTRPIVRIRKDSSGSNNRRLLDHKAKKQIALPALAWLTVLGSLLGCLGVAGIVWSAGYSSGDLLSMESLTTVSRAFSIARYYEEYRPPLFVQLLTLGMYSGALFGGSLFAHSQNKRAHLLALFPFLPALGFTIVLTTRASLLFQAILWSSTYIATTILLNGWRTALFTKRFLFLLLLFIPTLLSIFSLALMARYAEGWDAFQSLLWPRVRVDIVGHLAGFSEWLKSSWQDDLTPSYGAFTFAGIFEILGLRSRIPGMYEELIEVGSGDLVAATNIYTSFRGLIEDFTLPMALIILFLIGLVGGSAYRQVCTGSLVSVPLLACFYCFALWSHIVSFTAYNTLLVAYLLFFIYTGIVHAAMQSHIIFGQGYKHHVGLSQQP